MTVLRQVVVLVAGLGLVLVLTLLAFGLPLGPSLERMAAGALGPDRSFAPTFVRMTPLLLTGLGMTIAWRAGMFNIGGEGQFVAGALVGASVFRLASALPGPALNFAILIAAVIGGALWASIAGWLAVRRGVNVVISTILLNFVALRLLDYLVKGPLQESARRLPQTERLPPDVMLATFSAQSDLHAGVFVMPFAVALAYFLLFRTREGFRIRLVGANPRAARASRVPTSAVQVRALALSGAFCGLAGGIEYTGMTGQIGLGFPAGWGFLAIPAALLGGLNPLGVTLSAAYFGALFAGCENLGRFVPQGTTLIYVIQGVVVLGLVGFLGLRERRRPAAPEED